MDRVKVFVGAILCVISKTTLGILTFQNSTIIYYRETFVPIAQNISADLHHLLVLKQKNFVGVVKLL